MASFSRCVLSLALLLATLFSTSSAVVFNYTNFFNPVAGCSVTVGADGSIYVGQPAHAPSRQHAHACEATHSQPLAASLTPVTHILLCPALVACAGICSTGTILKLDSAYSSSTFSSYNSAVQQTLAPYGTNSLNVLQLRQLGISGDGTLWFRDEYNLRVLGVDSTSGTQVKVIDLSSVGGSLALGVTTASSNIWVSTPGASTGTATIVQYDTNGNVLKTISSSNDPTNLPSTYIVIGLEPDATGAVVYAGGCNVPTAGNLVYTPGTNFEYATAAGSFGPCDIRAINIASGTVQLPVLSVSSATNAYYGTQGEFIFQNIVVRGGTALNGLFPAGTVFAYESEFLGITFAWNNVTGAQIGNFSGPAAAPAFTPANNFVFIGSEGQTVQQYNGGQSSSVYNISTLTFAYPEFVAVGNGGSPIYVASEICGPLAIMNSQAQVTGYIGPATLCAGVTAVDGSGNVYVIDEALNVGYQFSSSGALLANYSYPNTYIGAGICVDPNNGNVAIPADNATSTTAGAGFVLYYNNAGTLLNIFGQSISYPWACTILNNSQIIVDGSSGTGTVYTITPSTGAVTQFTDSNNNNIELYGLAATNDGRVFVAGLDLGIYVYNQNGAYLGTISAPSEDIYAYNMYYTSSGGGLLYVADLFGHRIVTFTVGTSGPNGSSAAPHTVSSLTATAVLTVAALLFTLLISA